MQNWTNDELVARWKALGAEYAEKSKVLVPLLQKVSNLEKELMVLGQELMKRGINSDKENG